MAVDPLSQNGVVVNYHHFDLCLFGLRGGLSGLGRRGLEPHVHREVWEKSRYDLVTSLVIIWQNAVFGTSLLLGCRIKIWNAECQYAVCHAEFAVSFRCVLLC